MELAYDHQANGTGVIITKQMEMAFRMRPILFTP
jgi:hypothetical protein